MFVLALLGVVIVMGVLGALAGTIERQNVPIGLKIALGLGSAAVLALLAYVVSRH